MILLKGLMSAYTSKKVRWADIETQKELERSGSFKRKVLIIQSLIYYFIIKYSNWVINRFMKESRQ